MIRYFAQLEKGIVKQVIVADNLDWCLKNLGGEWVETFMDSEKNYAGIGHEYDKEKDNFIPPQPFKSWVLNEKCLWEAPAKYPKNGRKHVWDEDKLIWEELN